MENEIDWKFWLKRKSVFEIEMALLTLGLNPENFDIDFFMDRHYLINRDDLQALKKDYDKRMIFIRENRFTTYKYMADEDDSILFYFDSTGTISVKKFLLWLKNEDMGWDLPPELKAHIDSLSNSNNSNQNEISFKIFSPKEWHPICEEYANKIISNNSQLSLKQVSEMILDQFKAENIISVNGKPFSLTTITRHLSDWGFNDKRTRLLNSNNS
jgi:hypothetical protein